MVETPLDVAVKSIGNKVMVTLRDGDRTFSGDLRSIDMHLNVVLENAEETVSGESTRNLGRIIIRGDKVLFVSL